MNHASNNTMTNEELFDQYISGTLKNVDQFEQELKSNTEFKKQFEAHVLLINILKNNDKNKKFKAALSLFIKNKKDITKPIVIESFFGKTFAIAASVAIITIICTLALLSAGGYILQKQKDEITELKRDVTELKYSQDAIIFGITEVSKKKYNYAPANIEGTGFALNNEGYIITSWHLINGADSVFVANDICERTSAIVIGHHSNYDVAILKLNNSELFKLKPVPYVFKMSKSQIGEKLFTLGFPRKDMVYGEGSLSSLSGFKNDTSMYQISIPVNAGNSGGPVLDEQGSVIGVIHGKQASSEGTAFALKSKIIEELLAEIEAEQTIEPIKINKRKTKISYLNRVEQIKHIRPYIFDVMIYKK